MKAGDVVNGYLILEDFKVVGAGLSKWTYAERDGRQYFIKEFLSPTYPDDAAPGSAKTKAKKRARCATFENQHRGMQKALAPLSTYGGNLIVTLDFFRWGAKYYKVTEKVDAEDLGPGGIAALGLRSQLVLMKSVAHSLKILHDLRIVHGDLKPSNILVKRTELGYTSKLIDFDSSYIAGNPPPFTEIVGTINYYSPELLGYIQDVGVQPGELGVASDIFALGLIYTEFLTGAVPPFDTATYHEPAVAVRSGETLRIPRDGIAPILADLVDAMLLAEPTQRPTIAQVHATLMGIRQPSDPVTPAAPTTIRSSRSTVKSPTPTAAPSGALRGKGLRITDAALAHGPRSGEPAAIPGACRQARRQADQTTTAMNPLGPVWRCRVCEGVNRTGRVCATCGAEVPVGEPLRAAVRTVKPSSSRPAAPPPVPPNPTRRELRSYPIPEEIHPVDIRRPARLRQRLRDPPPPRRMHDQRRPTHPPLLARRRDHHAGCREGGHRATWCLAGTTASPLRRTSFEPTEKSATASPEPSSRPKPCRWRIDDRASAEPSQLVGMQRAHGWGQPGVVAEQEVAFAVVAHGGVGGWRGLVGGDRVLEPR